MCFWLFNQRELFPCLGKNIHLDTVPTEIKCPLSGTLPSLGARRLDWSWIFSLLSIYLRYRGDILCASAPVIGVIGPDLEPWSISPTPGNPLAWAAGLLVWAPGASTGAEHFHYYQFILGKERCDLRLGARHRRNQDNITLFLQGAYIVPVDPPWKFQAPG